MESDWSKLIPSGNIGGAIEFLNTLSWDISLAQEDARWEAYSGERSLVAVKSAAELEAFLLGMTVGLAVLPVSILDEIKRLVAE